MATATIDRVASPSPADPTPRTAVTLVNVEWDTYCRLRDEPRNGHLRMAYLDGELTLMSPEYVHEGDAYLLGLLVVGVTSGLGLEVKGIRTTTLRRGTAPLRGSGKEPDNAFYLGENERRMRGLKLRGRLDLAVDPPPDLAIEVDNSHDSQAALPIYARLGVPEVWRHDVRAGVLWFGRLEGDVYREVERSVGLPRLTPTLVLEALAVLDGGEMGENAWLEWLKAWARGLPEPPAA
jgi:Uma2 family endonuclease